MNYPVTINKAVELTGKSKSYWYHGNGKQFTVSDDGGSIMVLLHLYTIHLEMKCQNTKALDQPVKQPSKSVSPIAASDTTKSCQSSPMLSDFAKQTISA